LCQSVTCRIFRLIVLTFNVEEPTSEISSHDGVFRVYSITKFIIRLPTFAKLRYEKYHNRNTKFRTLFYFLNSNVISVYIFVLIGKTSEKPLLEYMSKKLNTRQCIGLLFDRSQLRELNEEKESEIAIIIVERI